MADITLSPFGRLLVPVYGPEAFQFAVKTGRSDSLLGCLVALLNVILDGHLTDVKKRAAIQVLLPASLLDQLDAILDGSLTDVEKRAIIKDLLPHYLMMNSTNEMVQLVESVVPPPPPPPPVPAPKPSVRRPASISSRVPRISTSSTPAKP